MENALDTARLPGQPGRLLTVGIPVFNGKSLLRNCLQSVINSTLARDQFEIVIADDGSTDRETLAILEDFEKSLATDPGFFRVISLGVNSGGAARPRNRILDVAAGEYVFFIDSDDTIGILTLERIAEAVAATHPDWIALNQVAVNGRAAVCRVRQPQAEVPRARALSTLTIHKVFRRAEIERQQLRFDEKLPSGQDLSFAFSFIVNASRFLMLGGYDYYYLTQHADNPNEPAHLSRSVASPGALIEKYERILRSMLAVVESSDLPESERRAIVSERVLTRLLVNQGYLQAIVNAGPVAGSAALARLSELFADPLVAGIDRAEVKGLTAAQFGAIVDADWALLADLMSPAARFGLSARMARRASRLVETVSGRARHRQVLYELDLLRNAVEDLRTETRRLDANLQAEYRRREAGDRK